MPVRCPKRRFGWQMQRPWSRQPFNQMEIDLQQKMSRKMEKSQRTEVVSLYRRTRLCICLNFSLFTTTVFTRNLLSFVADLLLQISKNYSVLIRFCLYSLAVSSSLIELQTAQTSLFFEVFHKKNCLQFSAFQDNYYFLYSL